MTRELWQSDQNDSLNQFKSSQIFLNFLKIAWSLKVIFYMNFLAILSKFGFVDYKKLNFNNKSTNFFNYKSTDLRIWKGLIIG